MFFPSLVSRAQRFTTRKSRGAFWKGCCMRACIDHHQFAIKLRLCSALRLLLFTLTGERHWIFRFFPGTLLYGLKDLFFGSSLSVLTWYHSLTFLVCGFCSRRTDEQVGFFYKLKIWSMTEILVEWTFILKRVSFVLLFNSLRLGFYQNSNVMTLTDDNLFVWDREIFPVCFGTSNFNIVHALFIWIKIILGFHFSHCAFAQAFYGSPFFQSLGSFYCPDSISRVPNFSCLTRDPSLTDNLLSATPEIISALPGIIKWFT